LFIVVNNNRLQLVVFCALLFYRLNSLAQCRGRDPRSPYPVFLALWVL